MRTAVGMLALVLSNSFAHGEEFKIQFATKGKSMPAFKAIVLTVAGSPSPGAMKHMPVGAVNQYDKAVALKNAGPFDVWWEPKSGVAVLLKAGLQLIANEETKIVVDDIVGVVTLRGDDQPRGQLVIAPQDDPGYGERGHKTIQKGDLREALVAPDGFYSLWLVPENGGRPRRIIDRFRVLAGKAVLLD